jgi:hypothetical protein
MVIIPRCSTAFLTAIHNLCDKKKKSHETEGSQNKYQFYELPECDTM